MVYKILAWVAKIFMGVQSKSFRVISSCEFSKQLLQKCLLHKLILNSEHLT